MLHAPSRIGPMVSISVTLEDALVLSTVLQRVIKAVSIMSRCALEEDLYGVTTFYHLLISSKE